jgi:VPDSG-CTERM motif
MKTKWMITTAVAALLGFSATVQAVPIAGSIGVSGTYTLNGANLASSTSLAITSTSLGSALGSFSGGALTFFATPIGVNGAVGNLVNATLWTLKAGSTIYTFTVTSEAQGATSPSSLALSGSGTVTDNVSGADTSFGAWQLNFGAIGGSFTWQNTSGTNVPDGGTTVLLLGAAFSGLGLLRRKLTA